MENPDDFPSDFHVDDSDSLYGGIEFEFYLSDSGPEEHDESEVDEIDLLTMMICL